MRMQIEIPYEAMAACSEIWKEWPGTDVTLPQFGLTPVEGADQADLWATNGRMLVRLRLSGLPVMSPCSGYVFDGGVPEIPTASLVRLVLAGGHGDDWLEVNDAKHALSRRPALPIDEAAKRAVGSDPDEWDAGLMWSHRYVGAIMRSAARVAQGMGYERVFIQKSGNAMVVTVPPDYLTDGIADARWVLMGIARIDGQPPRPGPL